MRIFLPARAALLLAVYWLPANAEQSPAAQRLPPARTANAVDAPQQPKTDETGDVPLGAPIAYGRLDYPEQALADHIQGAVVLRLLVGKNGKVKSVSVVSGDSLLADATVHAARKWIYGSYFVNGKPAEAATSVTINFKIADDGKPNVSAAYPVPKGLGFSEAFKVGDGITAPKVISAPDPEYSEKARVAQYQGICVLGLIVGADGRPYDVRVKRHLGEGLDEKAIEAVKRWKFQPAMKDGQPVAVAVNVEVTFRLH